VKASVKEVRVIRVEPLERIGASNDQAEVAIGFSEKDGILRVAHAHTFFLPPYKADGEPMFSNFREIATLAKEHFTQGKRLAALTHDARVTFIRRAIYWDYRHFLSFEEVRSLEAARISSDSAFKGPRPSWAPAAH